MYGYLAAGVLALLIIVGAIGYQEGKQAGIAKCQSERVEASNEAQKATDERDRTASESRTSMLDYLATQKPAIEIKTHETTERIRIVYKDRVVPAACAAVVKRPDRVQDEINQARERANRTISSLRLGTPANDSPGAGMAGDRPVGSDHDRLVRAGSHAPERFQPLPVWIAGIGRDPVAP